MRPHEVARTFLGTPFVHHGRSRKGVDCVGLLMLVAQETDTPHVDNPHYGREPTHSNQAFGLRDYLARNCGAPLDRDPRPDDILLIRFKPHLAPSHLAIVSPHAQGLGMIHTHGGAGRVVEHRIDDRWQRRIVEVYQWPAKR